MDTSKADMSTTTERTPGRPTGPRPPATFIYAVAGLLVAVLLLGAGGFLWLTGSTDGPSIGGPFTLENSSGKTVTDRDFRGKYMLVYFGYTYCPDVCPTTLNAVADALDKLGAKAKDLRPIFITVDPQRDTPDVMKQYTGAFSPNLIGLTGTPDEIANVAKEYRVYYAKHVTGPGPNDYSMDHSSILYLMGPDGQFIAPIRADESGDEMAATIGKLVG
jgi:protein SCO1/2